MTTGIFAFKCSAGVNRYLGIGSYVAWLKISQPKTFSSDLLRTVLCAKNAGLITICYTGVV